MRKFIIMSLTALASVPVVGLAAISATAPVFADTPGQGAACVSQSLNPHPTDPAGTTTATLFCTTPTPNPGTNSGSSGGSGSNGSTGAKTGGGATTGGAQTSLASSTGSGPAASTPDESMRFNWASGSNGATSSGKPATAQGTGLFGSLVSFFSSVGGLVTLFGLLLLLILVLAAVAVMGWLRTGQHKNWSSRLSRLTFRA
jgi:hypothetical protein